MQLLTLRACYLHRLIGVCSMNMTSNLVIQPALLLLKGVSVPAYLCRVCLGGSSPHVALLCQDDVPL